MNCPGAGDECTCGHDLDSLADSIAGGNMIKYYQADFEFVPEDALWHCTITAHWTRYHGKGHMPIDAYELAERELKKETDLA